jgi:hypothetical protein
MWSPVAGRAQRSHPVFERSVPHGVAMVRNRDLEELKQACVELADTKMGGTFRRVEES